MGQVVALATGSLPCAGEGNVRHGPVSMATFASWGEPLGGYLVPCLAAFFFFFFLRVFCAVFNFSFFGKWLEERVHLQKVRVDCVWQQIIPKF